MCPSVTAATLHHSSRNSCDFHKLMGKDAEGMVRLRVFFEDHRLLNNSQISDGLGRCWVLLKPSIITFADLAAHLRDKFAIPNLLVLFIDDFVLPPFESTRLLKNTDIIRVKLNNVKVKDALLPSDGENTVQDPQIARARGSLSHNNTMVDDKSQTNSQGNGNNENGVHDGNFSLGVGVLEQKRVHSLELHNSVRKRQKLNCTEEHVTSVSVQDIHSRQNGTLFHVIGGSKKEFPVQDNAHDDILVVDLPVSEVSLGEPSSSMPCKGRQQSEGSSSALESEPHIASDVTKEYVLSSPATIENDQNQFTAMTFNGRRNYCSDVNKKELSGFCMENHAWIHRKPEGDSLDNKAKTVEHKIDFATLFPLTRSPLKGDILAYRYVEPSSTVYPVLSSPQVGKVSSFDYKSSEILLVPAPEFEVFLEEHPKMPILPQTVSPYKEDGSLEIKLSALIDVRLLKAHDSKELACLPEGTFNRTKKDKWEMDLAKSNWNRFDAHHTDQKLEWDNWIPNNNTYIPSRPSQEPNFFPRGRANGAKYTADERRASASWVNGATPAAALFWETVLSKGTFGRGAKCCSSGKY